MISFLETYDMHTGQRDTVRMYSRIIEAPLWLPDGDTLLYSSLGRLWLYSISRDEERLLDTGSCRGCVNDYVLSRDGKTLYFNNIPLAPNDWSSFIHVMPLDGSAPPRLLIPETPSYAHSISPKGDLYFSGNRKNIRDEMDVFVLPADGGKEVLLTDGVGYNDAPDIMPDGSRIWFCSTRGGDGMQLWTMAPDGSDRQEITHSDHDCWYPHISPDGKTVIYLCVPRQEHIDNSEFIHVDASIRALSVADPAQDRELFRFNGGQCTINSSSWSPDSRFFAFVSYRE